MKNICKFEIKRAFTSRSFFAALALGVGIALADIICFYVGFHSEISEKVVMQAWIGVDYQFVFHSLFYILLPVIAAIPYAASYYTDLNSGYVKNLLLKTSRKHYYAAKTLAVFVSAVCSVTVPLLMNLLAVMAIYPFRMPDRLDFLSAGILDTDMFADAYADYPYLYCLIFIMIDGVCGGIAALFSVCAAEHVESRFSAIMLPFIGYIMWSTVMMERNGGKLAIMQAIDPLQSYGISGRTLLIMGAGIFAVASVWLYLKGRRKDII